MVDWWAGGSLLDDRKVSLLTAGQGSLMNKMQLQLQFHCFKQNVLRIFKPGLHKLQNCECTSELLVYFKQLAACRLAEHSKFCLESTKSTLVRSRLQAQTQPNLYRT